MEMNLDTVAVAPEGLGEPADLRGLFGNENPIELEIGCGKGGFLLKQAKAHPERNFFGIEWANKYCKYAADRMGRWGLTNVRVTRTDARHFVIHRLPPSILAALHVYHPDPWPKTRHLKRRLFSPEFITAATAAIEIGGRWAIQTDHAEYAEWIVERMTGRTDLEPIAFDDPAFGTVGERTETNFETKYLREGRPIHRFAYRRVS